MIWQEVVEYAKSEIKKRNLSSIYAKRLKFEIDEINKQGANAYWVNLINDGCKFDSNPNYLLLPWLFDMISDDPITTRTDDIILTSSYARVIEFINNKGYMPPELIRDSDNPDIDIDCLPAARDPIKEYAASRYSNGVDDGYGTVCSVGTWMTYLLRSAIKDVAGALAACDEKEVDELTKELPDEVDELKDNGESPCKSCKKVHKDAKCPYCGSTDTERLTIGKLLEENKLLRQFNESYPNVVDMAVRLVGRIRTMSKHAGALIIADRPLFGNIPMSYDQKMHQWKSLWTEGRNTQLSKLGYTKWDILGLKNLRYIYEASRMVEQNHGISFGERINKDFKFSPGHKVVVPSMSGWDYSDPEKRYAGFYYDRNGRKIYMDMDDPAIMAMASEGRTDAVFQFDTDLAKRILSNGVYSFNDLLIFNAMGHPGPMQCIAAHSKVMTDKGNVAIEELDNTKHSIAYLADGECVKFTPNFVPVKTGSKEIIKLTLEDGSELELTADHQVLTSAGYKRAGDLTSDDEVICCEQ